MGSTVPLRSFIVLDALSLGVFRVHARSPIALRSPTPALGCTSETGNELPGDFCSSALLEALRLQVADTLRPTGVVRRRLSHASRGLFSLWRHHRRSPVSRDYHPRHLPPLVFLRPPTVCSFDDSPVLFHTDTTSRIQRTTIGVLLSRVPDRSIRKRSRPGSRESDTLRDPEASQQKMSLRVAITLCSDEPLLPSIVPMLPLTRRTASSPSRRRASRHARLS